MTDIDPAQLAAIEDLATKLYTSGEPQLYTSPVYTSERTHHPACTLDHSLI